MRSGRKVQCVGRTDYVVRARPHRRLGPTGCFSTRLRMTWITRLVWRLRARWNGTLRSSRVLAEIAGALWLVAWLLPVGSRRQRIERLLVACRRSRLPFVRRMLRGHLKPLLQAPGGEECRRLEPGLTRYYAGFGGLQKRAVTTSLLLKAPGPNGEKGVLYSSFEYNWLRLAKHHDGREFFRRYLLVGQSSGSPPDFAPAGYLAGLSPDPVFVGVSNLADLSMLDMAAPVVRPIELMACDWVEPEAFSSRHPDERDIDIIMVANWLRLKRHWLLFEALAQMPSNLRVVLVGRNADRRNAEHMRLEARAFGVRQDLDIRTNIENQVVRDLLCRSRVSLLFSYREGSCVAPVESMFANTPVGMMRGCHVGSAAYINSATGVMLERRNLAHQLTAFLERSASFDARTWALANVSCHRSSERLNVILREYALSAGQPWTTDIAPLCWRYVPSYVHSADETRLAPAVAALQDELGVELVKFQYQPAK